MKLSLIILLIIGLALAFIFSELFKFKLGISSTRSVHKKGRKEVLLALREMALEQWNVEELDILSREGESDIDSDLYTTTETGQIYSIYQEAVLGYVIRTYKADEQRIMAARFNDQVLEYEESESETKVILNDSVFGSIRISDKIRFAGSGNTIEIGYLNKSSNFPVWINGDHILSINPDDSPENEHIRLLSQIGRLDPAHSIGLLAVLIYAVLDKQI
jgi:hypothetical protein